MKIKKINNFIIELIGIFCLAVFLNTNFNTKNVHASNLNNKITEVVVKNDSIIIHEDEKLDFFTKCHKEKTDSKLPDVSVEEYYQNMAGTHKINPDQLTKMVQAKRTIALMIGFPGCKYCRAFSRTVKKFTTLTTVPLYYLDISDLSKSDLTPEFLHIINDIVKLKGTPTVSLIKRGKLRRQYVGADTSLKKLMKLTKYKY